MGILMSDEIKEQMSKEIRISKDSLQVISGFCKIQGMEFVEKNITSSIGDKRLLVRFRMDDIITGASDIQLYEFCKEHKWRMFVRFDLHAKTYIFDKKRCILGSANLTNSGLRLSGAGNYEVASICEVEEGDICKINQMFNNAIEMNDELYERMLAQIKNADVNASKHFEWSKDIKELFKPTFDVLFTYDLPDTSSLYKYEDVDIEFLSLNSKWSVEEAKEAFRWSKAFLWLYTTLNNYGGEMYFGELTACLHNTLINDPKPYRKEVKELLQNLLQWIEELKMEEIMIDRPNYSQRVSINSLRSI